MRKLLLFVVERTKTILHVCFHIVTLLFWEPWWSVKIWNFRSSAATFSGTLQTKYHINILSVDSAALKLMFGVFGFTIALLDLQLGAYKYLLLFTFFTDPSYSIFPLSFYLGGIYTLFTRLPFIYFQRFQNDYK